MYDCRTIRRHAWLTNTKRRRVLMAFFWLESWTGTGKKEFSDSNLLDEQRIEELREDSKREGEEGIEGRRRCLCKST